MFLDGEVVSDTSGVLTRVPITDGMGGADEGGYAAGEMINGQC